MQFKAYHAYLVWSIAAVATVFLKDGLNADNVTRLLVIGILVLSLTVRQFLPSPVHPKGFFIAYGVLLAGLVEGAYMISEPVMPRLLITWESSLGEIAINYGLDLLLTTPVYALIFWVIWKLLHKFSYTTWEYVILMGLGQALGDGNVFFWASPAMLVFIPYIMLNYHAMNVSPFLSVQKHVEGIPHSVSLWKYPITVLALVATYLFGGGIIAQIAKLIS